MRPNVPVRNMIQVGRVDESAIRRTGEHRAASFVFKSRIRTKLTAILPRNDNSWILLAVLFLRNLGSWSRQHVALTFGNGRLVDEIDAFREGLPEPIRDELPAHRTDAFVFIPIEMAELYVEALDELSDECRHESVDEVRDLLRHQIRAFLDRGTR